MSWPERAHTLPDRRELRATYDGEPVGWVVHIVGHEDQPIAGRDIHDVLVDLLAPGDGGWPSWFIEAANDLAARDTPAGRRYPCPCCGYLTLDEAPTGTYDICKVCFWEDDNIQFHNPGLRRRREQGQPQPGTRQLPPPPRQRNPLPQQRPAAPSLRAAVVPIRISAH